MRFTRRLLLSAEGADGAPPLLFSSAPEVLALLEPALVRVPEIEVRARVRARSGERALTRVGAQCAEEDTNLDGRADALNLTLTLPLRAGEEVRRLTLAAFVEVRLQSRVRLRMESLLFVDVAGATAGSEALVVGDVRLRQTAPLRVEGVREDYAASLLDAGSARAIQDVLFGPLLLRDAARNGGLGASRSPARSLAHSRPPAPHRAESIAFDQRTLWVSGRGPSFRLQVRARVADQPVAYVPDAAETLKFAWVQYAALLLLVYLPLWWVRDLVYSQQLVASWRVSDAQPVAKAHVF